MKLEFFKYQGTGNDFILIDDRKKSSQLSPKQIAHLCDRRFGIGGDGLMLLQEKEAYDFEMIYFNSDGKPSSMCGNGGRCITAFAKKLKLIEKSATFIAVDGVHEANIEGDYVQLKMNDIASIKSKNDEFILDTGSPHCVIYTNELEVKNVNAEGKRIRSRKEFGPEGINVNFVQKVADNHIAVRTFERGVEAETLSCGTGVTASALVEMMGKNGEHNMAISTIGGTLRVKAKNENDSFSNVWLSGPAHFVFSGIIEVADD